MQAALPRPAQLSRCLALEGPLHCENLLHGCLCTTQNWELKRPCCLHPGNPGRAQESVTHPAAGDQKPRDAVA